MITAGLNGLKQGSFMILYAEMVMMMFTLQGGGKV